MASSTIPTLSSIETIYPETAVQTQKKRWTNLLQHFHKIYSRPADFVSRSPGRVNLIGEHIDYSLYAVVPMAVEQDVLIAVAITPTKDNEPARVRLANLDGDRFPNQEFTLGEDGTVDIDSTRLDWGNYFKAGLQGAAELLKKISKPGPGKQHLDILATGSVPAGGGMSSSAAFVCASALAVIRATGVKDVDKRALVEAAVVSERAVGVNSGGMDQSASVFGEKGSALHVQFTPELTARPVSFPELKKPLTFVVAQSLVAADKHVSAPVCYNLRVVECTLAALVLAKITGIEKSLEDSSPLGVSLRSFHDAYFAKKGYSEDYENDIAKEKAQLDQLLKLVEDYLPQEDGYTREQISDILGTPIPKLEEKYMTKFPVRADRFKLRQRATHVFAEARRAINFLSLLESEAPTTDADSTALINDLGALLNDTQDSCRDVYECSCPELDELCKLARSAGSAGSRLTGAGWGGCTVHLVPADKVDAVTAAWREKFYKKRFPDMTEEKLQEAIVVSKPGRGSCVFDVQGRDSV